jgi:hypothetical protein
MKELRHVEIRRDFPEDFGAEIWSGSLERRLCVLRPGLSGPERGTRGGLRPPHRLAALGAEGVDCGEVPHDLADERFGVDVGLDLHAERLAAISQELLKR